MMTHSRRSLLSAIGVALPFGIARRVRASPNTDDMALVLRFHPFEESVREAFAVDDRMPDCRRIEVGHSELVLAGVQGCHNDRPFAGFPEGALRIVRAGFAPGPVRDGVRLYLSTVDVALARDLPPGSPSRPLNFASLPPAPLFS